MPSTDLSDELIAKFLQIFISNSKPMVLKIFTETAVQKFDILFILLAILSPNSYAFETLYYLFMQIPVPLTWICSRLSDHSLFPPVSGYLLGLCSGSSERHRRSHARWP